MDMQLKKYKNMEKEMMKNKEIKLKEIHLFNENGKEIILDSESYDLDIYFNKIYNKGIWIKIK